MTYTQRLKRATKHAFTRNPERGWAAAKGSARTRLENYGVYPSTPALMRYYNYLQRTDGQTTTVETEPAPVA